MGRVVGAMVYVWVIRVKKNKQKEVANNEQNRRNDRRNRSIQWLTR